MSFSGIYQFNRAPYASSEGGVQGGFSNFGIEREVHIDVKVVGLFCQLPLTLIDPSPMSRSAFAGRIEQIDRLKRDFFKGTQMIMGTEGLEGFDALKWQFATYCAQQTSFSGDLYRDSFPTSLAMEGLEKIWADRMSAILVSANEKQYFGMRKELLKLVENAKGLQQYYVKCAFEEIAKKLMSTNRISRASDIIHAFFMSCVSAMPFKDHGLILQQATIEQKKVYLERVLKMTSIKRELDHFKQSSKMLMFKYEDLKEIPQDMEGFLNYVDRVQHLGVTVREKVPALKKSAEELQAFFKDITEVLLAEPCSEDLKKLINQRIGVEFLRGFQIIEKKMKCLQEAIESLGRKYEIPKDFICPISLAIPQEPVFIISRNPQNSGVIVNEPAFYDRSQLARWMQSNRRSPTTRNIIIEMRSAQEKFATEIKKWRNDCAL